MYRVIHVAACQSQSTRLNTVRLHLNSLPALVIAVLLLQFTTVDVKAEMIVPNDPIALARMEILAENYPRAREVLEAEIGQGDESDQKDVARVLYRTISTLHLSDAKSKPIDPGPVSSHSDAVQAEIAREKVFLLGQTGRRADALAAYNAFFTSYENQATPFDFHYAVYYAWINNRPAEALRYWKQGTSRFPDDPVTQYTETVMLHFVDNRNEGLELTRKLEASSIEPLLSLVRVRKLYYLSGGATSEADLDEAKQAAKSIILAERIDPLLAIPPITQMLPLADHRDRAATWMVQVSSLLRDPAEAEVLRAAAVKEFLRVGEAVEASHQLDAWQQAGFNTSALKKLVDADIWTIGGVVPAQMLTGGSGWRVTAIGTPFFRGGEPFGDREMVVLQQSCIVDKNGNFKVQGPGATLNGLVLSGEDRSGHFVVKELGRGLRMVRKGDVAYPADVLLPPTDPPAQHQLNSNEFALDDSLNIGADFPPQLIVLSVPRPAHFDPSRLVVKQDGSLAPGEPAVLPAQILDVSGTTVQVGVWRGLKKGEDARLHISFDGSEKTHSPLAKVIVTRDSAGTVVDTGSAQFRIVSDGDITDLNRGAFLQAVKGRDDVWRGTPAWEGTVKPTHVAVKQVLAGPIRTSFLCTYEFSNGAKREVTLSFDSGQPYMLIDEKATESFSGNWKWTLDSGEGFTDAYHAFRSGRLEEPLMARLPRFSASLRDYAYFSDGGGASILIGATAPTARDAVTLFEVHPGDWTNPGNPNDLPLDDNPDAPWLLDRYTGSRNTMISTVVTRNGEMPFTIPMSAGVRRWGVAVTDQKAAEPVQSANPQATWSIERLVHSFNRGDLNRFIAMKLVWPEGGKGPLQTQIQNRLAELAKSMRVGLFAKAQKDTDVASAYGMGPSMTMAGVERRDPALVWLGWRDIYSHLRNFASGALSIDTTREGDQLNIVGNRGFKPEVTGYLIDDDLGLVTPLERQEIRSYAALLAYRYRDADWMNYNVNAGQPNFEADRLLQLSAFAASFPDHPDSREFALHVASYESELLRHWTIRDGGKWAENVGNYYSHSFDCIAGTLFYLDAMGLANEVISSSYFAPFALFGNNVVQIPQPLDNSWFRNPGIDPMPGPLIRKLPGMGAHGGNGGNVPSVNRLLMAQIVEKKLPQLASSLTALWQAAGEPIDGDFGEYSMQFLLFGHSNYAAQRLELEPKRLPGWGMVMRDAVGTDKEFYLALRAGTKAYRDIGNGSEFVMGALGRPLSLDGGDLGGPEQRTNLLIRERDAKHGVDGLIPVPLGSITRWLVSGAVQYARAEFSQNLKDPLRTSRDILFARNDYVLVHDEILRQKDSLGVFNFCTPAAAVQMTPQGLLIRGKLGADLWLTKLADEQPPVETKEMRYGNERIVLPELLDRFSSSNLWKQIAVRIPVGVSGTVLLYPVKSGGSAPQIRRLADGIWEISGPGFKDVFFEGDGNVNVGAYGTITFKGKLGLWRPAEEGRPPSFSMLNGESVILDGTNYSSLEPMTYSLDGGTVRKTVQNDQ